MLFRRLGLLKITSAIALLLIVGVFFSFFFNSFPISLSSQDSIRFIISSIPLYLMMYISILLHVFTWINNHSYSIIISNPEQVEWGVHFKVFLETRTNKQLSIVRIESQYFNTIFFTELDKLHTDLERSTAFKNVELEVRQEYRDNPRSLLEARSLSYILYATLSGNAKSFPVERKFKNPFSGEK